MYDNLKERLTDMSVLASTRTPADALQYIEELEDKLAKALKALDAIRLYSTDGDAHRQARTTIAELTSSEAANGEAKGGKDE